MKLLEKGEKRNLCSRIEERREKVLFSVNKMCDHAVYLCFDTTSYISVICTDYH